MEKGLFKLLKKLNTGEGLEEYLPETPEQFQQMQYLVNNDLVDANQCSGLHPSGKERREIGWFERIKITHKGRQYYFQLEQRFPHPLKRFSKGLYYVITLLGSLIVAAVGLLADWNSLLK